MGDKAGDSSQWPQRITLQKTEKVDALSSTTIGPSGSAGFGYGIENDRFKLHDYAGLDVKGKIVVTLRGSPLGLPSEEAPCLSSIKAETVQAHGAIGMIVIDALLSARTRSWQKRQSMNTGVSFIWVGPDGVACNESPGIGANAGLSDKAAQALFAGAPKSLAQLRAIAEQNGGMPRGFALKTGARISARSISHRVTSPNVVAMLSGSDPVLKDQYAVLSGHLDHLGISKVKPGDPADKDLTKNGAMDNAAEVATTLEVARVLSGDNMKPRRPVIFLISTGEEKGLLGAGYYAHNPTVPPDKIVCNVDLDMPLLLYPFTGVVASAAGH